LRFSAPIFTYKNILDKAGIYLNANPSESETIEDEGALSAPETFGIESEDSNPENSYKKFSLSELHDLLETAVQDEDYEKAARIRDEISKRES
jgi:excinuclease UvrABC helicase subunit UvrB